MNRALLIRRSVGIAVIGGSILLSSLPATRSMMLPSQPPSSVGVATDIALPSAVANARFVDQRGTPETLGALKGMTVFLVPYLTLCGATCPFTTGNLLQLQALLTKDQARNVQGIGIDIDPYRDTRARIAAYSRRIDANFQRWTESGPTSTPRITPSELASWNPVGHGELNANLLDVEKFRSWTAQIVPQSSPPETDSRARWAT